MKRAWAICPGLFHYLCIMLSRVRAGCSKRIPQQRNRPPSARIPAPACRPAEGSSAEPLSPSPRQSIQYSDFPPLDVLPIRRLPSPCFHQPHRKARAFPLRRPKFRESVPSSSPQHTIGTPLSRIMPIKLPQCSHTKNFICFTSFD